MNRTIPAHSTHTLGRHSIQTSAAMGMAAAAQLLGQPLPDALLQQGVLAEKLSPARFQT